MLDIAIIIRTRNESRWINFCLNSISRQNFSDYKVVIVDGLRTPIGTYNGSLKNIRADKLGSIVIKEILDTF